ncbi:MAG TPA: phytanoyl-CoA dioxygenase family protein [Stellaceae bacterium]|nr:phytanoyl-CoA dioxygenase family protein [Stellaceae bacterium]
MTPEQVLAIAPKALTQKQREFYFENGYLLLAGIVPLETVERLRQVTADLVEETRALSRSDAKWDLDRGHSPQKIKLRRLSSPCDHHPAYWEYASGAPLADIAADLLGPDVKFHHSKLNFKADAGGAEVEWHQDIQFWPHTNYSPLTIGTYLYDCGPQQGPLGVIAGSHKGELFDQYGENGEWTGRIGERDLARLPLDRAQYLCGPAGSLTIHNCRTVHGSEPNDSEAPRPLFLVTYSSADAIPYTPNPLRSPHAGRIVRGKPARWAQHDPRPCLMPPDWSGGYTSIFALQQQDR